MNSRSWAQDASDRGVDNCLSAKHGCTTLVYVCLKGYMCALRGKCLGTFLPEPRIRRGVRESRGSTREASDPGTSSSSALVASNARSTGFDCLRKASNALPIA